MTSSVGFFRDGSIANAFAANESGGESYNKTVECFVLTDGQEGFLVGRAVTLLDDEQAALKIREAALAKLTLAERAVLKI